MAPRRQIRAFTLSAAASDLVDIIYAAATNQADPDRSYALLKALGLASTAAIDVDNCILRSEDYDAIRTLTGVKSDKTGAEFLRAAASRSATRGALRSLILSAQRRNSKAASPPAVNASRIVDALIFLGAKVVEATSAATAAPVAPVKTKLTKLTKQPPITDWERKAPMYVKDPIRKAFIEANLAKIKKPPKRAV